MSLKDLVSDPAWLFDLGFSVRRWPGTVDPSSPASWQLGDAYRLPAVKSLSGDEDASGSWMAWSDREILLQVHLPQANPACSLNTNISLDFYIDTRSSPGIHRANAYCHLFQLRFRQPAAIPLENAPADVRPGLISRAKGFPIYARANEVRGWLSASRSRLEMKMTLPYTSLAGCDPVEFPEWGVAWVASDGRKRYELARNSLSVPVDDPSLWCRARLVETSDA